MKDLLDQIDSLTLTQSQELLNLLSAKISPRNTTDNDDEDSRQNLFVAAYIVHKGSVHKACREVGIPHRLFERWSSDPLFKSKLAFGKETWIEQLRSVAHELAIVSRDRDMIKFLLVNYSPDEFDSGLRKQLAQNQGTLDAVSQVHELSREEVLASLKNDPMVDYSDPEFWQHIDAKPKA